MAMNPTPYSETSNHNGYDGYLTAITLPSGSKYEIVDENARNKINTLANSTKFLGVTTSNIVDGSTTTVVTISGSSVTAAAGDIVIKTTNDSDAGQLAQEFIFDGTQWQLFGDISTQNLGNLAYVSSATGSYTKFKSLTSTSSTVSSTGSYTPTGSIALTTTPNTIKITSTTTNPGAGNTANHWIYTPAGSISVTYVKPSTSASVIKTVTGKTVVTSLSTAAPTSSTPTGAIGYANVDNHVLQLNVISAASASSVTYTTTNAYVSVANANTTTCSFSGTTHYVSPITVTIPTSASFNGTAATISVSSSSKFLNSVTYATESATVTVSA